MTATHLRPVVHPRVHIGIRVPSPFKQIFINLRAHIKGFQRGADALHVGAGLTQSGRQSFLQIMDVAHQHRIAAEIAQIAPDERLPEERLRGAPHLRFFTEIIEKDQFFTGHSRQVGTQAFRGPRLAFVVKHPRHLQPSGLRVGLTQGVVDVFRHIRQIFRLPLRRVHLIERIHAIDVVGAENGCLLVQKTFLNLGKQRIRRIQKMCRFEAAPRTQWLDVRLRVHIGKTGRHVARESRQHRCHVQLALACQDPLLQFFLALNPRHRQRAAKAVEVGHAMPWQMRRTGKIATNLLIGQTVLLPHFIPDSLLTGDSQRHGDAVQRHPVDETFPLLPLPPRHRIAERAVVEEEPFPYQSLLAHRLYNQRVMAWKLHRLVRVPRHIHMRVVLQVIIEPHRHGVVVVAGDADFAVHRLQQEVIQRVRLADKHKVRVIGTQYTMSQTVNRAGGGNSQTAHHGKPEENMFHII